MHQGLLEIYEVARKATTVRGGGVRIPLRTCNLWVLYEGLTVIMNKFVVPWFFFSSDKYTNFFWYRNIPTSIIILILSWNSEAFWQSNVHQYIFHQLNDKSNQKYVYTSIYVAINVVERQKCDHILRYALLFIKNWFYVPEDKGLSKIWVRSSVFLEGVYNKNLRKHVKNLSLCIFVTFLPIGHKFR